MMGGSWLRFSRTAVCFLARRMTPMTLMTRMTLAGRDIKKPPIKGSFRDVQIKSQSLEAAGSCISCHCSDISWDESSVVGTQFVPPFNSSRGTSWMDFIPFYISAEPWKIPVLIGCCNGSCYLVCGWATSHGKLAKLLASSLSSTILLVIQSSRILVVDLVFLVGNP